MARPGLASSSFASYGGILFAAKPLCAIFLLILSLTSRFSQDALPAPPQLRSRPADEKHKAPLLIDAIVLDGQGKPVVGLQQSDFGLLDDRKKVPQTSWQLLAQGTPVSQAPQVLIILDAINSSLSDLARTKAAIESYLKKGDGPLPQRTTILFVSEAPSQHAPSQQTGNHPQGNATTMVLDQQKLLVHRTPASTDRNALLLAFHDYKAGLSGTNDAQGSVVHADQVRLSLQALSYVASAYTPIKGPKLVLWLGPGWPFLAQSAARSSEQLFDSIIYFTNVLQDAQITLYSISPEGVMSGDTSARTEAFELAQRASSNRSINGTPPPNVPVDLSNSYYGGFLQGVRSSNQSNPKNLDLQVLAFHTGGLIINRNNDLVAQIESCVADASAMYVFSYTPGESARPDIYHDISIHSAHKFGAIRSTTGFYTR